MDNSKVTKMQYTKLEWEKYGSSAVLDSLCSLGILGVKSPLQLVRGMWQLNDYLETVFIYLVKRINVGKKTWVNGEFFEECRVRLFAEARHAHSH